MEGYLDFAKTLARQSGRLIRDNFDSNLQVELKSDHTPVTQVDKRINELVIKAVEEKYPNHGILGEEADSGTGNEDYQWLCDPLDGTAAFILGMQHSTFILALLHNGKPQLSIIYNPFTDQLYHAVKGRGAFCNDRPIRVNQQPLKEGYVLYGDSARPLFDVIASTGASLEPAAGAGYRAVLVASGHACAVVQPKGDNHDVGPASLIVEEAGGRVTDLSGRPIKVAEPLQNGIILSNGLVHDELLRVIRSGR